MRLINSIPINKLSRSWVPKLTGLVDGYTMKVIVKSRSSIFPPGGPLAFWRYLPPRILPKIILRWLFNDSYHSAFILNV